MNYAFLSYVLLLLDPRFWNIPFLFRGDSHDLARRKSLRNHIYQRLRSLIFRRFRAFLAVGNANYRYYRANGVPASKLFMARHAVDNQRFHGAKEEAASKAQSLRAHLGIDQQKVILFVGKFVSIKRPLDLLTAYANLPRHLIESSRIVFVGDGPLRQTIGTHAEALSLQDIHFLPFQNQRMMPAVYSMGDVLVLPSESETWGLVVNEAMNLECPAIVSDHVGCSNDLVVHGSTGWVYPTGDIQTLTQCLADGLQDPARLQQISRRASEHVRNFSYEGITASLNEALHKVYRKTLIRKRLAAQKASQSPWLL